MKKSVDQFIKEHKYVDYCEATIDELGLVEYVNPNHIENMVRVTGKTKEEIYDMMDITDFPLEWLVEHTNSVCIWSDGYMIPKEITRLQKISLEKLVEHKLVANRDFKGGIELRKVRENLFASEYQIELILNLFEISCERTTCKECNLVEVKSTQNDCRARFLYDQILKRE